MSTTSTVKDVPRRIADNALFLSLLCNKERKEAPNAIATNMLATIVKKVFVI
jgi:hypothetical protein